ncbi:MAG: 50S ribosomal protein L4 [Candidatus Fermentibacteraceae bacterium]|nr:50S ribosomal protein L4 [Candidatus Fermentibacteraceae bacterium]MBN2609762.1 50S ribosomal protein L4 [Candidatus Fermentibacteraceae bacterium]
MADARVYTMAGEEVGNTDLPEEMFGMNVSTHILWEAVRAESLNSRQGTVSTLGRSEVQASGRKPWRQKGTGNARSGSLTSPIWRGGGVAFGPKPRKWNIRLNRKVRRKALAGILSERLAEGNLRVVRDLKSTGRTREMADMLSNHECRDRRTLLLVQDGDQMIKRASRNIPNLKAADASSVSIHDLVNSEVVLLSEEAIELLKERLI